MREQVVPLVQLALLRAVPAVELGDHLVRPLAVLHEADPLVAHRVHAVEALVALHVDRLAEHRALRPGEDHVDVVHSHTAFLSVLHPHHVG